MRIIGSMLVGLTALGWSAIEPADAMSTDPCDTRSAGRELAAAFRAATLSADAQALLHHRRGRLLMRAGDYRRAIEAYETALVLRPDFADAYLSRGRLRVA